MKHFVFQVKTPLRRRHTRVRAHSRESADGARERWRCDARAGGQGTTHVDVQQRKAIADGPLRAQPAHACACDDAQRHRGFFSAFSLSVELGGAVWRRRQRRLEGHRGRTPSVMEGGRGGAEVIFDLELFSSYRVRLVHCEHDAATACHAALLQGIPCAWQRIDVDATDGPTSTSLAGGRAEVCFFIHRRCTSKAEPLPPCDVERQVGMEVLPVLHEAIRNMIAHATAVPPLSFTRQGDVYLRRVMGDMCLTRPGTLAGDIPLARGLVQGPRGVGTRFGELKIGSDSVRLSLIVRALPATGARRAAAVRHSLLHQMQRETAEAAEAAAGVPSSSGRANAAGESGPPPAQSSSDDLGGRGRRPSSSCDPSAPASASPRPKRPRGEGVPEPSLDARDTEGEEALDSSLLGLDDILDLVEPDTETEPRHGACDDEPIAHARPPARTAPGELEAGAPEGSVGESALLDTDGATASDSSAVAALFAGALTQPAPPAETPKPRGSVYAPLVKRSGSSLLDGLAYRPLSVSGDATPAAAATPPLTPGLVSVSRPAASPKAGLLRGHAKVPEPPWVVDAAEGLTDSTMCPGGTPGSCLGQALGQHIRTLLEQLSLSPVDGLLRHRPELRQCRCDESALQMELVQSRHRASRFSEDGPDSARPLLPESDLQSCSVAAAATLDCFGGVLRAALGADTVSGPRPAYPRPVYAPLVTAASASAAPTSDASERDGSTGEGTTCDPSGLELRPPPESPSLLVGCDGCVLSVSPIALAWWEKAKLQPLAMKKQLTYAVLSPDYVPTAVVTSHLQQLAVMFQACRLGSLCPLGPVSADWLYTYRAVYGEPEQTLQVLPTAPPPLLPSLLVDVGIDGLSSAQFGPSPYGPLS